MKERVIYQADRTKEEIVNEQKRLQRLERELDCGEKADFILDRQVELYDELEALIKTEDEKQLEEVRGILAREELQNCT